MSFVQLADQADQASKSLVHRSLLPTALVQRPATVDVQLQAGILSMLPPPLHKHRLDAALDVMHVLCLALRLRARILGTVAAPSLLQLLLALNAGDSRQRACKLSLLFALLDWGGRCLAVGSHGLPEHLRAGSVHQF